MRVQTRRLELIAATVEMARAEIGDRARLAGLVNARVPEGWPPPLNDESSMQYSVRFLEANPDGVGWSLWYLALVDAATGERTLIGNGGFKGKPSSDGTVEIGYSVMKEHQGVGYATEAVRGLLAWAFSRPEVTRVIAETYPELKASIRVMEKNGFVPVGRGSEAGVIRFELTHARAEIQGEAMPRLQRDAVLIVVDVQKGFDDPAWGRRNNPEAEENIAKLLCHWRATARPIVYFQHLSTDPSSPLRPGFPGSAIKDSLQPRPDEPVFQKRVNSCFIGTDLEAWLRHRRYTTLVITGLTTPHCVSTTARMAGNLGFRTYVASDATAAFELKGPDGRRHDPEEIHAISLATLHGEFATVITTSDLLQLADSALRE